MRMILLGLLFSVSVAAASEFQPYVSVGGQFGLMMTYGPWSSGDPRDYGESDAFLDVPIELGVAWRNWEFFGMYQDVETYSDPYWTGFFYPDAMRTNRYWRREFWTNRRYLLGAHYRGNSATFRPLFGCGLDVGKIVRTNEQSEYTIYYAAEIDTFGITHYEETYRTPERKQVNVAKGALNIGGEIQIGIGYTVTKQVEMLGITRIQYAFANFGDDWLGNNYYDHDVVSPSFALMLRITPFGVRL